MTCKDCVHYIACKSMLEAMGYTVDGDGKNADQRCDTFETLDNLRPHGEWIHDYNNLYGCSNCMERETMSHKRMKPYCPNCGANMRKSERII